MAETSGFIKQIADQDFQNKIGFHYIGIVCIIAWYYWLWFTPSIFHSIALTDNLVTYSWLTTLACSGLFFIAIPLVLGEKHHLDRFEHLHWIAGIVLTGTTLAYTMLPNTFSSITLSMVIYPILFSLGNALLWLIWGEFYAVRRTGFSSWKVAPIFGIGILGTQAISAMVLMCCMMFCAGAACYYVIAIIPLDVLPDNGYGYPVGICGGSVILICMALYYNFVNKEGTIYRSIPWLLTACTIAIALYLSENNSLQYLSFLLAVSLVSVLEVLLITFFGTLSTKGYAAPAMAFGLSSGCIRLGFFAGDSLAVAYEANEAILSSVIPQDTALIFICILAIIMIPMLRQELKLTSLMDGPNQVMELSTVCAAITSEFKLSARESEILGLIARGYTVDSLAKKLVISPYTAQTHIRHIYSKMQIHKRSELLDYINMHRSDL